jgi:hypothetical protein
MPLIEVPWIWAEWSSRCSINAATSSVACSIKTKPLNLTQRVSRSLQLPNAANCHKSTTDNLAPFQAHPLTKLGPRNPGQVSLCRQSSGQPRFISSTDADHLLGKSCDVRLLALNSQDRTGTFPVNLKFFSVIRKIVPCYFFYEQSSKTLAAQGFLVEWVTIHGLNIDFSLYFSLLSANLVWETGSTATASATTHSRATRDFPTTLK